MPEASLQHQGADVILSGVTKSFGSLEAVKAVHIHVPAGSFFSLLGPSGCGKSTTLRMIAGFELPDEGKIMIGETDVTTSPPQARPTAMVFQNYALFPHMSVSGNVEYGLKVRRIEKNERLSRIQSSLARVEMDSFMDVPVTDLSGGQQQRVALARAIAIQPKVLLFDEPLSNLDVALREQTRRELKRMQNALGLTSIYVTHDQEEAMSLSDALAVMRDGSIVQVGTPRELYDTPATAFVAQFLGGSNILDAAAAKQLSDSAGDPGTVMAVRPESIEIGENGRFEGRLVDRQYLGKSQDLWIDWENQQLRVSARADLNVSENIRFNVTGYSWVLDDRKK